MAETRSVESLSEFSKILSDHYYRHERGYWVFRGHCSITFQLVPKVGRTSHTSKTRQKFEQSIFRMFKRSAVQYLNRMPAKVLLHHQLCNTGKNDGEYRPLVIFGSVSLL